MEYPERRHRRAALVRLSAMALLVQAVALPVCSQDGFSTEVRLAVDRSAARSAGVGRSGETGLKAALERRLPLLAERGGAVSVNAPDDIRVRVPVPKLDPLQLQAFTRPGRFEVRHLKDVQTNLNPRGRYLMDYLSIQGGREERSELRFLDRRENRRVPAAEFLRKCPVLLTNADLAPGAAETIGGDAQAAVRVHLTEKATRKLEGFMKKPGRLMAIVLDDDLRAINAVVRRVRTGKKREKSGPEQEDAVGQMDIGGSFANAADAGYVAAVLNAGPLPAPVRVLSTSLVAE